MAHEDLIQNNEQENRNNQSHDMITTGKEEIRKVFNLEEEKMRTCTLDMDKVRQPLNDSYRAQKKRQDEKKEKEINCKLP